MCHKTQCKIFCLEMVKSKNYTNINKGMPEVNSLVNWDVIVFDNKELTDNNWLFHHEDKKVIEEAKEQWNWLKTFDDYMMILE